MFKKPLGFRGTKPVVRSNLLAQQQWSSQRGAATGRILGGLAAAVGGGFVGKACYDVNVRRRVQKGIKPEESFVKNTAIPVLLGAGAAEGLFLITLGIIAAAKKMRRGSVSKSKEVIIPADVPHNPLELIEPQGTEAQELRDDLARELDILLRREGSSVQTPLGEATEIDLSLADMEEIEQGGTEIIAEPSDDETFVLPGTPGKKRLDAIRAETGIEVTRFMTGESNVIPEADIQKIGPYKILGYIGGGGMKDVYLSRDRKHGLVTIHVPKGIDDRNARARVVQEVKSLWRVKHPSVMAVYKQKLNAPRPYFVAEYIEGISLGDFIEKKVGLIPSGEEKGLPASQALAIYYWILLGLREMHRGNVIHRDLKPDNIMLTKYGLAKIIDFGLGKIIDASDGLTRTGIFMGAPTYWTTEMAKFRGSDKLDFRADIQALGLILYTMLKGDPPRRYLGDPRAQVLSFFSYATSDDPVFPDLTSLPKPLQELLHMTTIKDRDYRLCDHDEIERMVLNAMQEL